MSLLPEPAFSLAADRGYAELFQYLKALTIAVSFIAMAWQTREGLYGAWAVLFVYVLCDDAMEIHESAGRALSTHWDYDSAFGLRAVDLGELTVSALAGIPLLGLITYFYRRSSHRARDASKDLVLLLAILVFFGIVVDMVHSLVEDLALQGLTIIEDSGEMVSMSLIAGYAVQLRRRHVHAPGLLWRSTMTAFKAPR